MKSLSTLALLGLLAAASANAGDVVVQESVASRLILGDSSTVEIVGRISGKAGHVDQSAFLRIKGNTYAVAASSEGCGVLDLRISSGKTEIRIRSDWDFSRDGLPVPQTVTIGDETTRFFWGAPEVVPAARRRTAAAVRKMPPEFLEALKLMAALADSGEGGVPYALLHLLPLFEEALPVVTVLDRIPLSSQEADGLAREAGIRAGK